MSGRDEIREMILGAAEGATGSVAALAAIGSPATIEDFDVEVQMGPGGDRSDLRAVVRFSIAVAPVLEAHRSVA